MAVFLLFNDVIELLNLAARYAPELLLFPFASHLNTVKDVIFGAEYGRTVAVVLAVAVLPLESVTVTEMVNVPLPATTPVVKLAVVYVFPSAVVLYAFMVEALLPEAVISTLNFDIPCTYAPYVEAYPSESETDNETVGFTLDGIAQVMVFVFVPIEVLPVNVSMVKTTLTLVPVVF